MDVIGKNQEREIDKINLFSESTAVKHPSRVGH